jgi:hypothetical protein
MADPSVSSIAIYQLRVLLYGVSPLVWRRLLVISETSLAELQSDDAVDGIDSDGQGTAGASG